MYIYKNQIQCVHRMSDKLGLKYIAFAMVYSNFPADILKIDGLWEFVNLTKLQLDNNIIEKVEGIDMLVNLVWLGKFMYIM